ncbi:MAG: Gfo/Idh/MocA family protein [Promethearchaeota archaeon]
MLRVGVVGTGAMGRNHVRVYSGMNDVELVAVSDSSPETLEHITTQYSCEGYLNFQDMLKKENLDAVTIAVPTKLHLNVAKVFLEVGIHVLVEKPIAVSVEEAEKLITIAKENNRVLMVGHIERYNPAISKLEELISKGDLGKILTCSARRLGPYPPRITDVGVVIDWTVHDIDIMRLLCQSEPITVFCRGKSVETSHEDYAIMLLEFENGVLGTIEADWLTQTRVRTLSVTGSKSFAELDYMNQQIELRGKVGDLKYQNFDELIKRLGQLSRWQPFVEKREPLKNELEDFIRAIQTQTLPKATGADGLQSIKIASAALQSIKEKKPIFIK